VTTGWSEDGRQQRYIIGYFGTRAEALAALAEYHKTPIGIQRDVTLGELYEKWYANYYTKAPPEDQEKRFKTAESYRTAWNHLSVLKDMKVREIKTSHLQDVIHTMENEKGLSYSSCHKVKVLAGILMKLALADDIIDTNYANMVKVSKGEKKKAEIFSDLEIKRLWEHVDTVEWVDTILIFIYTGMRIKEMLTLTKFNVDIDEMLITGGVKTDAGRDRIIPIHEDIQPLVRKWYNMPGSHFISRDGKPIRPEYYRQYLYYPTLEKLGIRRLNPHKARHTFSTLLHRAGVDMDTRQKLLGHSDVATTMHYTHPDIETLRRGIAQINILKAK
jgi:integrase